MKSPRACGGFFQEAPGEPGDPPGSPINALKATTLDKRVFGTLFFAIFSAVTGVGIVVPLLPVYAHDLGATGLYIGLIFGAFSISRSVFLPFFGSTSDRKGRKPFIVTGLFLYSVISVAFVLAGSVESFIIIRFFQGIASAMIMPVVQAYVGDITPCGQEGFIMGIFNMSVFCGLSLGPIIGGIIHDSFSMDTSFICMGAMSLAAFVMCLFLLPKTGEEQAMVREAAPARWRTLLRDRGILALWFFRFAYTMCIGVIWSFLPIFADTRFSLSSSATGVLVMLGVFVSGAIQTPMGYLADRTDRNRMIIYGGIIAAVAIFSLKWSQGFWSLFASNFLFGIGGGIAMPALMGLTVVKGSESSAIGSVMGLLTMAHSLGMMVGAVIAGLTMDLFDLRSAFSLGGVVMLCGVLLYHLLMEKPAA